MAGALTRDIQDLTRKDYELVRRLVYAKSGINLGDQKMQLVRARLGKKIRQGNFASFREYVRHVEQDSTGQELSELLDAISTNTTHLFREMHHFNLLREHVTAWVDDEAWCAKNTTLRVWSAACSSGEEPYSIAMVLHDVLRGRNGIDARVLATDLSTRMLATAKSGLYEVERTETVPKQYRHYLKKVSHDGRKLVQVAPDIRRMIRFAHFNLMTPTFPFQRGFDVILCRNVMIYFDRQTQETLVNKLAQQLHQGGCLMIGHSESLNSIRHPLTYVEPTIYRR